MICEDEPIGYGARFGGFRFVIIGDNGYLILLAIDLQPAGSVDLLCAHFRAARELDPPLRCRAGHRPEHPDLEGLRRRAGARTKGAECQANRKQSLWQMARMH